MPIITVTLLRGGAGLLVDRITFVKELDSTIDDLPERDVGGICISHTFITPSTKSRPLVGVRKSDTE